MLNATMPTADRISMPISTDLLPGLEGQTAIVTGGASGIGFHVTKQLLQLGAKVMIGKESRMLQISLMFIYFL